jgi:hypothetical protein
MLKRFIARIFGFKSLGYSNIYKRSDGEFMSGSMIYPTKQIAIMRGRCRAAKSDYIGTKEIFTN